MDEVEGYDRIDPTEVEDILAEPGQDYDPIEQDEQQVEPDDDEEEEREAPNVETVTDDDDDDTQQTTSSRPQREVSQPSRLTYNDRGQVSIQASITDLERRHCLVQQSIKDGTVDEYTADLAPVIAMVMTEINAKAKAEGACFGPQLNLRQGLKKWPVKGAQAAAKEIDQLHQRTCFVPIDVSKLTQEEKRKAVEALMFLTEKRDGTIKGRMVYNGKPTRAYIPKDDASSPTAHLESIFLTVTVDAHEERDVLSADVPNAFIQTWLPEGKKGEERVIMKITGVLVDLLVKMVPDVYGPFVVLENGKKVIYVVVLKALYGMLVAALLWYKKFRADLEKTGFEFNPYDPCVANKKINGKQQTIRFHVDDVMSSHVDPRVNDKFLKWLNDKYGSYGEVKATRGPVHDYLGMTFDFSKKGEVKVSMVDYVEKIWSRRHGCYSSCRRPIRRRYGR